MDFTGTSLSGLTHVGVINLEMQVLPDLTVDSDPDQATATEDVAATATLGTDGDLIDYIGYDPAAGSEFPVGDKRVFQRLIDAASISVVAHSFTMTVVADVTAPVITASDIAVSTDACAALAANGIALPASFAAPSGTATIHMRSARPQDLHPDGQRHAGSGLRRRARNHSGFGGLWRHG